MTKLCGAVWCEVYIAIYDQAVWCDILLFMTKLCGVMYIAIYDQAVWCDSVYCYL